MEIEKLLDIKILCGQVIEKVNELLEAVDADKVNINSLSEIAKLHTEEAELEDVDIKELSNLSKFSSQDELLDETIKNGVEAVLSYDEEKKLEESFESIMNTIPEQDDSSIFSENADLTVYKTEDDYLSDAIEESNIIINDSIANKEEDMSYEEIANAISTTSPVDEEE